MQDTALEQTRPQDLSLSNKSAAAGTQVDDAAITNRSDLDASNASPSKTWMMTGWNRCGLCGLHRPEQCHETPAMACVIGKE